jgi:hypothetical protein
VKILKQGEREIKLLSPIIFPYMALPHPATNPRITAQGQKLESLESLSLLE